MGRSRILSNIGNEESYRIICLMFLWVYEVGKYVYRYIINKVKIY